MNILVLGGTRFFGKTLVEDLLRAGHAVTVLSRGKLPPPEGAAHIIVDRTDPAALAAALAGRSFDAVVDNVAMNADHVGAALDALGDRAGHYVFTSSVSVYADFSRGLLWREADLDAEALAIDPPDGHPYTIGKRRAELLLLREARSHVPFHDGARSGPEPRNGFAVPFTIVRPGYVVGPHDHLQRMQFFLWRIQGGGPIVTPSGAGEIFQLAWHADVAAAIARTIGNPSTFGRAYNIAGAELFTYPTLVRALATACGAQTECLEVPRSVLRRGVLENEELPFGEDGSMWACDVTRLRDELGARSTAAPAWMAELARAETPAPPPDYAEKRAAELACLRAEPAT